MVAVVTQMFRTYALQSHNSKPPSPNALQSRTPIQTPSSVAMAMRDNPTEQWRHSSSDTKYWESANNLKQKIKILKMNPNYNSRITDNSNRTIWKDQEQRLKELAGTQDRCDLAPPRCRAHAGLRGLGCNNKRDDAHTMGCILAWKPVMLFNNQTRD